jgi:hypothetical protein
VSQAPDGVFHDPDVNQHKLSKKEVNMNILSRCRPKIPSRTSVTATVLGLALVSLAHTAVAQTRGKATIDFPFLAGSTQCPAGTYDFETDEKKVTLRSTDPKGPTVVMLVVTRLGRHDKDKVPEFVFDKVGDQLKLSEVWPPEQDGYLTLITPEYHQHRVVNGSK